MITRRNVIQSVVCALPIARGMAAVNSTIRGVRVGVQSASFSFSGFNLDQIIQTMQQIGLDHVDMMSEHVENYLGAPVDLPGAGRSLPQPGAASPAKPPSAEREREQAAMRQAMQRMRDSPEAKKKRAELRDWRLSVDLEKFQLVQKKFNAAGLEFFSYNLSFRDDFTDEEIDRGFLMTKALGTKVITVSSPVSVLSRVARFADKHGVIVAVHNHSRIGENEIATPQSFENAMSISKNMWTNLDIGHFFAAGFDPVTYIQKHHARITNIHLKDRLRDNGPSVAFGEGDTPIKEVLHLLRDSKYSIPVEIEHVGPDGPPSEIGRCFEFCKSILLQ